MLTGTFGCVAQGIAGEREGTRGSVLNDVGRVTPDPYPEWPKPGDPMPEPKSHSSDDEDPTYGTAV